MTREEQSKRREEVLKAIQEGASPHEIGKIYELSTGYIYKLCRESGVEHVPIEKLRRLKTSTYLILADLFNPKLSYSQIANKYGIKKQRVEEIYHTAIESGIPIRRKEESGVQTPV